MVGYLKRRGDFAAVSILDITKFSAVLDATESQKSSFTVDAGMVGINDRGAFIMLEGRSALFLISDVKPKDSEVTVSCLPAINIFDRDILYTAPAAGTSIEEYIATVIGDEFRDQSDSVYRYAYLDPVSVSETEFAAPETDDYGVYNLLDYLRRCDQEFGIYLRFIPRQTSLEVRVQMRGQHEDVIAFGDGQNELVTREFSTGSISKVTAVQDDGEGGVTTEDWYLAADGSISTTEPAQRAEGGWSIMTFSESTEAEDIEARVRTRLSQKGASHRIEFRSSLSFEVGDRIRMRMDGGVVVGTISAVGIVSGDNRTHYTSGELPVTLSDKVRRLYGY